MPVTVFDIVILSSLLFLIPGQRLRIPRILAGVQGSFYIGGCFLLLAAISVSGVLKGNATIASIQVLQAAVTLIVVPLVILNVFQSEHLAKFGVKVYVGALALSAASAIIVYQLFGAEMVVSGGAARRFDGFFNNPNELARLLAIGLVFTSYLMIRTKEKHRILWLLIAVLFTYSVLATGSFSGILAVALSLLTFLMFVGPLRASALIIVLSAIAAATWYWIDIPVAFERRILGFYASGDLALAGSYVTRVRLAATGMEMLAEHPWFGIGPGMFIEAAGLPSKVHTAWLHTAIESGVIALLGFALIMLSLTMVLVRSMLAGEADRFVVAAYAGVLVGLFAGISASPSMFVREWWLPMFLAVRLLDASVSASRLKRLAHTGSPTSIRAAHRSVAARVNA